jgi:3-deoxy-manno-octulosonate cytidylyltransferase (CMP-KDO synthetase)
MGTIGVIPARYASTRFPGKILAMICGKPLICWVVENACRASRLDEIIVATDDKRIADTVKGSGAVAVMTREDHQSGTDRIAEAVEGRDADVIVNIQGDEPLIDPGLIDRLAARIEESSDWDMATAAAAVTDADMLRRPQVVKVVCDARGRALYFSRSVIPHVRDGAIEDNLGLYRRHIGIYAYRREFLARMVAEPLCELEKAEKLEQLRALHIGGRIAVLETDESGVGVDTPEDAGIVEREIRRRMQASA